MDYCFSIAKVHVFNFVHFFNVQKKRKRMGCHLSIYLLYAFFWVITRRLNFLCRCFGKISLFHFHTYPPMKMEQGVPKRRHIKFRRRGITQKKAYNIQNTAEV